MQLYDLHKVPLYGTSPTLMAHNTRLGDLGHAAARRSTLKWKVLSGHSGGWRLGLIHV